MTMPQKSSTDSAVLFPFDPHRLRRDLVMDQMLRYAILWGVPFAGGGLCLWLGQSDSTLSVMIALLIGVQMMLGIFSAGVWRQLANPAKLLEMPEEQVQTQLAQALLTRRPLTRSVRIMAYHRLAMLRYRQGLHAQVILICHSLLTERLPRGSTLRPHLLLMLAESQLVCEDMPGLFLTLTELSRQPLTLLGSLQKLALQTRYLVLTGQGRSALTDLHRKVKLFELMPPVHCGAMHILLGLAANQTGQTQLAQWCKTRAKLLLGQKQHDALQQSVCQSLPVWPVPL